MPYGRSHKTTTTTTQRTRPGPESTTNGDSGTIRVKNQNRPKVLLVPCTRLEIGTTVELTTMSVRSWNMVSSRPLHMRPCAQGTDAEHHYLHASSSSILCRAQTHGHPIRSVERLSDELGGRHACMPRPSLHLCRFGEAPGYIPCSDGLHLNHGVLEP